MRRFLMLTVCVVALLSPGTSQSEEVFDLMGNYIAPNCAFALSDTSQALSTAFNAACASPAVNWNEVKAVTIMPTTNGAVVSVGTTAVQGASQVGFTLSAGSSVRFAGKALAQRLNVINYTNGSNARIQVLVEY